MSPEIQPGAVFIADAHYQPERTGLVGLLQELTDAPPPQLFLMGDIFDLHIGCFDYLARRNAPLIRAIETLAAATEVWFFEGNHDFLLDGSLRGVRYVPLSQQPMRFTCRSRAVDLAHGDYDESLLHTLFTRLIRSRTGLGLVHLLSLNFLGDWFLRRTVGNLSAKRLCRDFPEFESKIRRKITKNPSDADIIIEGHYHQGSRFNVGDTRYINVDGFACNQSYIVLESGQDMINFRVKKYKR